MRQSTVIVGRERLETFHRQRKSAGFDGFAIALVLVGFIRRFWSGRPGSNRRRPAWEAGILPLNYARSGNGSEEIYMGLHQACQCEVARSVFATPAIFQSLLIVSIRRELTAEARRTRSKEFLIKYWNFSVLCGREKKSKFGDMSRSRMSAVSQL